MAAFARIELEQRITQLQMQHYHQLRLQEQQRASRQHELLNILHRENLLLTRINNNPGIMGRVSIVPSAHRSCRPKTMSASPDISGVIPEVVNNDLLREKLNRSRRPRRGQRLNDDIESSKRRMSFFMYCD